MFLNGPPSSGNAGQITVMDDSGGIIDKFAIPANKPTSGAAKPGQTIDWSGIGQGAATALQLYNQQRLADINLRRAQQGLSPISYEDIPGMVPTAQVGIDAGTRNSTLILAAVAIGAFLLFSMINRRSSDDE